MNLACLDILIGLVDVKQQSARDKLPRMHFELLHCITEGLSAAVEAG